MCLLCSLVSGMGCNHFLQFCFNVPVQTDAQDKNKVGLEEWSPLLRNFIWLDKITERIIQCFINCEIFMCAVLQLDSDEDRIYWDVWSKAIVYDYKTISHNMMTLSSITRFSVVRAWLGFTVTFEHAMTLPRNWTDFSLVWKLQLRQQVQQGSDGNTGLP